MSRIGWGDLFRPGIDYSRMHYSVEAGLIRNPEEDYDDVSATWYHLGDGSFLFDDMGLRITFGAVWLPDSYQEQVEGMFIPYTALQKYLRPEIYRLVSGKGG